jgi:hypothetical protein
LQMKLNSSVLTAIIPNRALAYEVIYAENGSA